MYARLNVATSKPSTSHFNGMVRVVSWQETTLIVLKLSELFRCEAM